MDIVREWDHNMVGLALALAIVALVACAVGVSRFSRHFKMFLLAALVMRVVGSIVRFFFYSEIYGKGDATRYYLWGLDYAERFLRFDFSPLYDTALWHRADWYGTQFVTFPSGFILTLLGPTILGEFIIFGLIGFFGVYCFARAFQTALPAVPAWRYLRWIAFFPSLWYWPSSVGKDALMLAGLGMATWGFVSGRQRMKVFGAAGLALVFAIRPQVVAVVFFCFIAGQWLASTRRWGMVRLAQGLVLLVVGLAGLRFSLIYAGLEEFDTDSVAAFVETGKGRDLGGGSAIAAVNVSVFSAPMGLVNALFRPMPWDIDNANLLMAFLETWILWAIVASRWRRVLEALRMATTDRFIAFSICFILAYSLSLGLMLNNIGILARQRIPVFFALFVLLEAVPHRKRARASVPQPASRFGTEAVEAPA